MCEVCMGYQMYMFQGKGVCKSEHDLSGKGLRFF